MALITKTVIMLFSGIGRKQAPSIVSTVTSQRNRIKKLVPLDLGRPERDYLITRGLVIAEGRLEPRDERADEPLELVVGAAGTGERGVRVEEHPPQDGAQLPYVSLARGRSPRMISE